MAKVASSWMISEEGSQSKPATVERFLFWRSGAMLFSCTTICQPLNARTENQIQLCISQLNTVSKKKLVMIIIC